MKRYATGFIAVLMLFVLAACGGRADIREADAEDRAPDAFAELLAEVGPGVVVGEVRWVCVRVEHEEEEGKYEECAYYVSYTQDNEDFYVEIYVGESDEDTFIGTWFYNSAEELIEDYEWIIEMSEEELEHEQEYEGIKYSLSYGTFSQSQIEEYFSED